MEIKIRYFSWLIVKTIDRKIRRFTADKRRVMNFREHSWIMIGFLQDFKDQNLFITFNIIAFLSCTFLYHMNKKSHLSSLDFFFDILFISLYLLSSWKYFSCNLSVNVSASYELIALILAMFANSKLEWCVYEGEAV